MVVLTLLLLEIIILEQVVAPVLAAHGISNKDIHGKLAGNYYDSDVTIVFCMGFLWQIKGP